MDREALKSKILSIFPEADIPEEEMQFLTVTIPGEALLKVLKPLREEADLTFDFFFCLSAVDMPDHILSVYHLRSTTLGHEVVIKAKLDREASEIHTVTHIWKTADFHEREAFDLMGIKYTNHPDMRRIFLEDDWVGHPLRKDYVDEVNMVEL